MLQPYSPGEFFAPDNSQSRHSYVWLRRKKFTLFKSALFILALLLTQFAYAQPSGFVEEPVGDSWDLAVGLTFTKDGQKMLVWEKGGKVWVVEDGEKAKTPLIDLTAEVANWGDHGLLGFELDPNFDSNGYIYLLYVVDRNYLMNYGKAGYDPANTSEREATIGRVTRYKVNTTNGVMQADLSSRKVLIGETPATGIPILYESHGVGSLVFGEDGSLLVSAGDGASAGWKDTGYRTTDPQKDIPVDTYIPQALEDGIITERENVGAFRAQQTTSLNGKILRIDPATGNGLPSNPFYESGNPRSAASRVWALGLRNPFRFSIRPGTGSSTMPGTIYAGDVGWMDWEEINVIDKGGLNLGWPIYEGLDKQQYYYHTQVANKAAPNPLYGQGNCDQQYFYFQNLIQPPLKEGEPYFGNPCDYFDVQIPENVNTYTWTRPVLDWVNDIVKNGVEPEAITRVAGFNEKGEAIYLNVGEAGSPVAGEPFYGSSSTGGIWYTGDDLPAEYKNTYFFGDYGAGWIRNLTFTDDHSPKQIKKFIDKDVHVTGFATNPATGGLYLINYATQIVKLAYYGNNTPPVAVAKADKLYGASPLTVKFTGSESSDPDGQALTYEWDFGDGTAKAAVANPTHTFTTNESGKNYNVVLKVTDTEGLSKTAKLVISVNNTPPVVHITSPAKGTKYPMTGKTTYKLTADVNDAEQANDQLTYSWQTALHHNTHEHPDPVDNNHETTATITPIGCDSETYFYRITLTVTDGGGLSGTDYVDVYPDCSAGQVATVSMASPSNNASFNAGEPINLSVNFADPARSWVKVQYFKNDVQIAAVEASPFNYSWQNASAGTYTIVAKATDAEGHTAEAAPITVTVTGDASGELDGCITGVVNYFGLDETSGGVYSDFASASTITCTDCPTPVAGKFNGAQHFDGVSTGADIMDGSNFNWGKDANFSFSLWVRSDAQKAGNTVIIGRDKSGSSTHWWIGLNPDGQAIFMLKDINHVGIYVGDKGPKINDGSWHQIVAVRDGANQKTRIYVDGTLAEEADYYYVNGFVTDDPVNIGYMDLDQGYHYEGDIDELKLYDRALTSAEVATTFNGGQGTYCGTSPLSVSEETANFEGVFEVFPNPSKGTAISVAVSELSPNEKVTLTLYDMTGKQVYVGQATSKLDGTLNTKLSPKKGLNAGVYNLLLTSGERTLSKKVLVLQ